MRNTTLALVPLFVLGTLGCASRERGDTSAPAPSPAVASRADADADAGAAAPIHVRLLAFNDFHGNLKPPTGRVPGVEGEVGGAAWFAAHLRKLGAGQPNTLVVAAGDLVGASPLTSGLFHDEPTVAVMNAIGLTATSLGNHELDEGFDEVLRLKSGGCHPKDGCRFEPMFTGARYDILAANVTRAKTPSPLPAYVVREVAGVPIAFVGMPLQGTPQAVTPAAVLGLSFADEAKTANALVPEIRARGIETIVLLIHEGGEVTPGGVDDCKDFHGPIVGIVERLDPAFDVVVSGHTHQLYDCRVGGRPVTSALSFGRVVTSIDLTIDPKTRDVIRSDAHNHAVTHDIAPDPVVQAIVDKAAAAASREENRVIGRISATLSGGRSGGGASLAEVVADAQLWATKPFGARVALMNGSGIRSDLLFAKSGDEKEDGLVTYGEAFAAQPFGNDVVLITVTGLELWTTLERSLNEASSIQVSEGIVAKWVEDGGRKRIVELTLDGVGVDPKKDVRVATNSFLADRDPTLKNGRDRVTKMGDLAALEAYFAAHPLISPPKKPRFVRK